MFKSVYIVKKLNAEDNAEVRCIVTHIEEVAEERHLFNLKKSDQCNENTLVVAVGGDGTMLEAMRIALKHNSVAMGINLGRVGFLTDFSATQSIRHTMEDVLEFADIIYTIERRLMLSFWINGEVEIAANEVSLSRDISDAMITYKLRFDNTDAGIYRANSILVSTPNGSTAYSLSAGGALMLPSINAVQVVPVAPLTLTARPIIVSHNTLVEIQAWGGKLAIRSDGQSKYNNDREFTAEDPLTLCVMGSKSVRILHDKEWNYFNMLSNKLGWIKE